MQRFLVNVQQRGPEPAGSLDRSENKNNGSGKQPIRRTLSGQVSDFEVCRA